MTLWLVVLYAEMNYELVKTWARLAPKMMFDGRI